jgi:hypothetical protein
MGEEEMRECMYLNNIPSGHPTAVSGIRLEDGGCQWRSVKQSV